MKLITAIVLVCLGLSPSAKSQDVSVSLPGATAITGVLDGTELVLVEATVPAGTMHLFPAYTGGYANPVIVVEGFDPQNDTFPLDVYAMVNTWGGIDIMRAAGRNVWIIDFGDGGGAITANAKLVSSAVQQAANWGGLTNVPVDIVGLSMGGVVTRYALAYDEQHGGGSDGLARLFISGDSPQQGANGPPSLQKIVLFSDDPDMYGMMNCHAALSMLYTNVRSYEDNGCSLGALPSATEWVGSSAAHNWFYSTLNALNVDGYPRKSRNVAVANGSLSPQPHNIGDTIYSARTYGRIFGIRFQACSQDYPAYELDIAPGSLGTDFAPGNVRTDSFELDEHFVATFIPTESALDIRNGASKFDRTLYQSSNLGHSVITPEATDFILEELLGPERRYNPKYLPDDVNATVYDWVVSAVFPGYFYMQSPERISGLRVISDATVGEGSVLTVRGQMSSFEGERSMLASSATVKEQVQAPKALAMSNRQLGGGDTGQYTSGIAGSYGLNNIGLLITTWGKVTGTGDGYLYIDDGSGLNDGMLNTGVRVICDPTGYEIGDFLVVTGISSCFDTGSGLARRILTRGAGDVLIAQD